MKKIVTVSLVSSVVALSLLFGANKESNVSKESNSTIKKETTVKNSLEIDLDKFQKKEGLKSGKPNPVGGTLKYSDNNDEVSYHPPQGDNNDEVIYLGKAEICLVGSRKTLFKKDFRLAIIKDEKPVSSYPKTYQNRRICVPVKEIKRGDSLLINDGFGNPAVEMKIEKSTN